MHVAVGDDDAIRAWSLVQRLSSLEAEQKRLTDELADVRSRANKDLTLPHGTWEEVFFNHVCVNGMLSLAWLMRSRGVSRGWRERIQQSMPFLRVVSFHVGVKGEDVLRALGLVAGGNLRVVGLALCRKLSARDVEEILKLLDATGA